MAGIIKRPESKYLIAVFTDANGRRLKRSTKSTDKKAAQKIADSFELAASRKKTVRHVRKVIASLHKDIAGASAASQSFRQYCEDWLERKRNEVEDVTLGFYKSTVTKFTKFLGDKADDDLAEIESGDVVQFRNRQAKSLAPKTVNHELKCLRMIFNAAREDGAVLDDPCEFVKLVKDSSKKRRPTFKVTSAARIRWPAARRSRAGTRRAPIPQTTT